MPKFKARGIAVASISYDNVATLSEFARRESIAYPMLADPDSRAIASFGMVDPDNGPENRADYVLRGFSLPGYFWIGCDGVIRERFIDASYGDRRTGGDIVAKLFPAAIEHRRVPGAHDIRISTGQSDLEVAPGSRLRLVVEVAMPKGVHVYAPGVQGGYKPVALELVLPESVSAAPAQYPEAKILDLPAIHQSAPVFEGRFTIEQELLIANDPRLMRIRGAPQTLKIDGTLHYQACNAKICFPPAKAPVSWEVKVHSLTRPRVSPQSRRRDPLHPGNRGRGSLAVERYFLDLRFDPATQSLAGSVAIEGRLLEADAREVVLDLSERLTVDSVQLSGSALSHQHTLDLLRVQIPSRTPTSLQLTIRYHGKPEGDGFSIDGAGEAATISSYGLPYRARQWWPCVDQPGARAASADAQFTVPKPLIVASNGRLERMVENGDGTRTFAWHIGHAIAPDAISIAAADYATFTSRYRSMPLEFYAFKPDLTKAQADFAMVPDLLATYAGLFGEYPFFDEKYGVAEFATQGFREHQTITALGAALITGDHRFENVLAHEVAHQWFGDALAVSTWSEVWLNEGFATYGSALWQEKKGGPEAYRARMKALDSGEIRGPLFLVDATDTDAMFTPTTFGRGAWVLHMLRHVIGEAPFFRGLQRYVREHLGGSVTTDALRSAMEKESGRDLRYFFDEWVLGAGRPTYAVSWRSGGDGLRVIVRQTQTDAPSFRMPVDLRVAGPGWERRTVLTVASAAETFRVDAPGEPRSVELDPDGWVLKSLREEKDSQRRD